MTRNIGRWVLNLRWADLRPGHKLPHILNSSTLSEISLTSNCGGPGTALLSDCNSLFLFACVPSLDSYSEERRGAIRNGMVRLEGIGHGPVGHQSASTFAPSNDDSIISETTRSRESISDKNMWDGGFLDFAFIRASCFRSAEGRDLRICGISTIVETWQ